jgi:hypothetical protein
VTVTGGAAQDLAIDSRDRIVVFGLDVRSGPDQFGLVRFIGDAVAPVASITAGPADGSLINDATPTFEFTSSEAGGTFSCGFDGFTAACTSPLTPGIALSDGVHSFNLGATDRAGNPSAALSRTFTIDTKAPEVEITGKKKVKTHKKKARDTLHIETSEHAELTCTVDQRPPEDCVAKFVTPKLKKGKHQVTVIATDAAGNSSDEDKQIKIVRKKP